MRLPHPAALLGAAAAGFHSVSHSCPGATATLRLCVTNCGYTRRAIRIDVPLDSKITVTPPAFMLEQLERQCSTLSVAVPADAAKDSEKEYLVWVAAAKNHYLRWTVKVSSRGGCSCHEVERRRLPRSRSSLVRSLLLPPALYQSNH